MKRKDVLKILKDPDFNGATLIKMMKQDILDLLNTVPDFEEMYREDLLDPICKIELYDVESQRIYFICYWNRAQWAFGLVVNEEFDAELGTITLDELIRDDDIPRVVIEQEFTPTPVSRVKEVVNIARERISKIEDLEV